MVALAALEPDLGVGSALLGAVEEEVARSGERAWLVMTDDNVDALRFHQRRGWDWIALHRDAVPEARRLKPEIPETGDHRIPILHELELEFRPPAA